MNESRMNHMSDMTCMYDLNATRRGSIPLYARVTNYEYGSQPNSDKSGDRRFLTDLKFLADTVEQVVCV